MSACGRVPYTAGFGIGVVAVSGEDASLAASFAVTETGPNVTRGPRCGVTRKGMKRGAKKGRDGR